MEELIHVGLGNFVPIELHKVSFSELICIDKVFCNAQVISSHICNPLAIDLG